MTSSWDKGTYTYKSGFLMMEMIYLVSYQHPPHGKGLVSLHNISCSGRTALSHNGKYIYVCVYTVVAVRLLCSVFSSAHTKSKVPKLATARKQRCIYASTNGSITCSHSIYVLEDSIQVPSICPKSLARHKLIF